jgi:hypothetical protein
MMNGSHTKSFCRFFNWRSTDSFKSSYEYRYVICWFTDTFIKLSCWYMNLWFSFDTSGGKMLSSWNKFNNIVLNIFFTCSNVLIWWVLIILNRKSQIVLCLPINTAIKRIVLWRCCSYNRLKIFWFLETDPVQE